MEETDRMSNVIPSLHDIEKRVLSKSIGDMPFFREFYNRFGNHKFATGIRNTLFSIIKSSGDGTDIEKLILRRKNTKGFKKLCRFYKMCRKRKITDSTESLLLEMDNVARAENNLKSIKSL